MTTGPGILRGWPWRAAVRTEATGALLLGAMLVHVLPLRVTQRLFGAVTPPDTSGSPTRVPPAIDRARAVAQRLRWIADRLPWTSTCLVRAVALGLLLKRRGLQGWSIRFGVSRKDGALAAHAWMVMGQDILIGGEEAADFTPLADLTGARQTGNNHDG